MKFIHYSDEKVGLDIHVYPDYIPPYEMKPRGLWFSVESDDFPDDNVNWKEWCETQEFCLDCLKYAHEITFKPDAKILHLKSPQEIWDLSEKYPSEPNKNILPMFFGKPYGINWVNMKKDYQGIIIAPYQWPCRLSVHCIWYYGWDCSSGCVWDLNCIDKFELVENKELLCERQD